MKQRNQTKAYEPFLIEVPEGEVQHVNVYVLKEVREVKSGWSVSTTDGTGFVIPYLPIKDWGKTYRKALVPEVGDHVALYGDFGRPIQGIEIEGKGVVFYRTAEQQADSHRRWVANRKAEQARTAVFRRSEQDAQYALLDPVLQERIDYFRSQDPDFRAESEGYEVYALLGGQNIAAWAENQAPEGQTPLEFLESARQINLGADSGDSFKAFNDLWTRLINEGVESVDGTNNLFSGSLRIAHALLRHRAGEDVQFFTRDDETTEETA